MIRRLSKCEHRFRAQPLRVGTPALYDTTGRQYWPEWVKKRLSAAAVTILGPQVIQNGTGGNGGNGTGTATGQIMPTPPDLWPASVPTPPDGAGGVSGTGIGGDGGPVYNTAGQFTIYIPIVIANSPDANITGVLGGGGLDAGLLNTLAAALASGGTKELNLGPLKITVDPEWLAQQQAASATEEPQA